MVSKVCSRSQGHPPGARSRAIIDLARSNFAPVDIKVMYHCGDFPQTITLPESCPMRVEFKSSGKNALRSVLDARRLLPLAFVLMLAFLVAMAWDSFSRTRELLSSQVYVEHTHQMLYELDAIQDGLGDAREAWLHYV